MKKLPFIALKNNGRNNIPRKDWLPTENCGLCEQHFVPSEYTTERFNDTNERRKNILGTVIKPRLEPDAVPSVFPNLPSYLTKTKHKERSQKAPSCCRTKMEQEYREHVEKEKLNKNMVKTLNELFDKISKNSDLDNHDVSLVQKEDTLMFISFSFSNMGQPICPVPRI